MMRIFKNGLWAALGLVLWSACTDSNAPKQPLQGTEADSLLHNEDIGLFDSEREREAWRKGVVFHWALDSTYYKDPQLLINKLDTFYGGLPNRKGKLSRPLRTPLYGYEGEVTLLEYAPDTAEWKLPFKYQYVFDQEGHLLEAFEFLSLRPFRVWDSLPPILLGVERIAVLPKTCGAHLAYRYEGGYLTDMFGADMFGMLQKGVPTYKNTPQETSTYAPAELSVSAADVNDDGWKDLVFTGKELQLRDETGKQYSPQKPFKTKDIRLVFLYYPGKEFFVWQE